MASDRITPILRTWRCRSPILLLDGTGERGGPKEKGGVELHLAIGLVARSRVGKRVRVEVRLLAATVAEPWTTMGTCSSMSAPGLVIVVGEEALADMVKTTFAQVPIQRCLFHLVRGATWLARYKDRCSKEFLAELRARPDGMLTTAYHDEISAFVHH